MLPPERWLEGADEHLRQTGKPLVTLAYAQSLDGSIAAQRGVPLALSGLQAMTLTHRLRAAHQGILVGVGTVLADDPQLTVRQVEGRHPQPIVLDSQLRTPPNARLFSHPRRPWIAAVQGHDPQRRAILEAAGASIHILPADGRGRVDLDALLDHLGACGVASLMVEGGAGVISSFLRAKLVDQVVITIALIFVGGLGAVDAWMADQEIRSASVDNFSRLKEWGCEPLGNDLTVWGKLV
jgi:3,4-dihydroxy 2-butanone 4-phosphate synthase/GTP cyclohydrolase II